MSTNCCSNSQKILSAIFTMMMIFSLLAVMPMADQNSSYAVGEKAAVTGDVVNVRSGAGTGYSVRGTVKKGYTFTVTGSSKDKSGVKWYKFTYKSKNGYISSKWVNIKRNSVISISNTKGTVKEGPLNVRKGPGTSYAKLGSMSKGKTFNVTGKAKDKSGVKWYRLTYSGKTGFVSSKYVTTKKTTSSSYTVTSISNTKGTVKEGPLNVRKGPGTSYAKLGSMSKGKTFNVTGKAKDKSGVKWYRLTYSGKTGFVSSKYVTTKKTTPANSVTISVGTVTADDGLNVRSGAGTGYSVLTILFKGSTIAITGSAKDSGGNTWYKYKYSSSKTGYVSSDYISKKTITSDSSFETYMNEQGFPASYKNGLRILHAQHPKWVFKAVKVGYSWDTVIYEESKVGRNLVEPSYPTSYRSKEKGAYNSSTGAYTRFDGRWYSASSTVIKYYMDPRNFLNESGIYQFMTHKYDSSSQNSTTVKSVIKGSFMEGVNPKGDYSSYQSLISAAGKASKVNPNVLAAMIIQEQGWNGSALVSGKNYRGYKGYYNFFNVGAFTTDKMNAVERGLWYAKEHGWTTPYKSIVGGVKFYADEYVTKKQDSYYTKKFNVKNGSSKVGTHQYMTNVSGAYSEGLLVKRAYDSNSNYPIVFELPVYNNMPSSACPLP